MVKDHEFIVFGAEHYNPLTVIRTLGREGICPVYIALKNKGRIASLSKFVKRNHFVDSIEEGYQILLQRYGHEEGKKPFLITTDDDIQEYLDLRYDELRDRFIFFGAGQKGRVTEFMDKKNILDLAVKHGLKVLPTVVLKKGEAPSDLQYPVLTKSISPNVGGWKSDVHICKDAEELKRAYDHILSPRVLVQPYLDKKNEYCIDGFSVDRGRRMFAPMAAMYNYLLPGYYSPYMTFYPFNDPYLMDACSGMLSEIGFEGIFSIEFLIDRDDNYFFTEINFRNSPWNYADALLGMPLPVMWAESMLQGSISRDAMPDRIPDNFTAMIEPVDYAKRVEGGMTGLGQWMMDFKSTQCPFYYDKEDPEPFLEMVRNWRVFS